MNIKQEKTKEPAQIDWNFFEYIIAYNCTLEETYTASIIDVLNIDFINNLNVRKYIGIIFDFHQKRGTLPNATEIKSYLNNDEMKAAYKDVVTQFSNLDKEYNLEELLENTERFLKERAVYHAVKATVEDVTQKNAVDTGEIFQRFDLACNISLVDDLGFNYLYDIDRHIENLHVVDQYISTGFRWLDKQIGGGFLKDGRALYNFVGATNSGKSIWLGNFAANIMKQNEAIVLITMEMSEMVYARRISSCLTNIPFYNLKAESDTLKNYVQEFCRMNSGAQLIIKEFPPNSVSSNHIKAYLSKLKKKTKIKIGAVVLDYMTLLQSILNTGSLYADGKAVSEQIRALSYPLNFGCPFLTAAQTNRSAYGEENPGIQTTGESMGITHTVDFQASIWSTDADKELGICHMGLQKSRFGPNFGTHAFRIDYDTLKITESEDVFGNTGEVQNSENILETLSRD
jgi:hypothetical protein